ncbi:MAG: hypothetical protein ACREMY_15125, partial [bacterium]
LSPVQTVVSASRNLLTAILRAAASPEGAESEDPASVHPGTPDEEDYAMAEVIKFQSSRLFQAEEFGDWEWTNVAGAGNFTGICAVPDPFDPVVDVCQVTQVWFSQPASGPPVTRFTIRKVRSAGGAMLFFVAGLLVR